ncbi:MAG: CDGSH iron-sulfur domain-containing protein [Acidimicrobiia bacterium]|nr:CDGSH iron-sulfur domain-containing protein [Acidimicrobiia bacterium]
MTTIKLRENGPLVIEGDDVTVVDWQGRPYEIARRPVALCRCGGSSRKPFCDGTHARLGFNGGESAKGELKAER